MAIEHKIKFYPVDNGDNTLIKLHDGITILTDCQIRSGNENSSGVKIYDVKSDLLNEIRRDKNGNPYIDLFILTHPHQDHCLGFKANFFTGNPTDYKESNKKNGEIIIGEIWVTQKVFSTENSIDANAIRTEANRRIRLFNENNSDAENQGNIVRIIGYNDKDKTVEGLHYIPGQTINVFNGDSSDYLELFIHAPFKSTLITSKAEEDENLASIVYQANFRLKKEGSIETKVIIGGDADHYVFDEIMKISKRKNREDRLKWDLLLAPHHCSWSFFNDTPVKDNPEPTSSSKEFLSYRETNAFVVTSSIEIENNNQNPPCYEAKIEYVKSVGSSRFYNTAVNEDKKAPKPIVFTISDGGISKSTVTLGASSLTSASIPRAGRK